jgi:tetratricopeptide (TPR) repeat protein
MRVRVSLLACATLLGACASRPAPPAPPTLATLAERRVDVAPDRAGQFGLAVDTAQAIEAYQDFLAADPASALRPHALRRLGDLEMERADERAADGAAPGGSAPDYRAAIARYQEVLRRHPDDPQVDRVLYQLARAQEQSGQLEAALATLDRLVAGHPGTLHRTEAQFRRGELLFAMRQYPKAEAAYADVLVRGDTVYRERALFMHGWAVYKQGRTEESLASFFGVLDLRVAGREGDSLEDLQGLSRADRELVEDTFRVVGLSVAALQGPQTIERQMTSPARRSYEFLVHQQLAELYLRQQRVKDAADALAAFARAHPLHAQAPKMLSRVIGIYEAQGFGTLALESKKDYVRHYGAQGDFRRANPAGWEAAQPLVKRHLADLARHQHAAAQKTRARADVQVAVRWYRELLQAFPADAGASANRFLLAELLFEDRQFAAAAVEYERVAYPGEGDPPPHPQRADAGYAALLAHTEGAKASGGAGRDAIDEGTVDSALRFVDRFPADPRAVVVLTDVAERLFAARQNERAAALAERVLAWQPAPAARERRVAATVLAHAAFEAGRFAEAERRYAEVLASLPAADGARGELAERMAAAVYRQGEQARDEGRARDAAGHFARVGALAPSSGVHAAAQLDAATALLGLKDWAGATQALEDLRRRFPDHPLARETAPKLALAYLEQQRWAEAAAEFERIGAAAADPAVARDALHQAATLYGKAGARTPAARAWERYLARYPQPIGPALEARAELALLARAEGRAARETALLEELVAAEAGAGAARTDRTRALAASAALTLAEPAAQAFRTVALVEPLQRALKVKKARLEEALRAYAAVGDYGVAEPTTAATFHTAALYQDFGRALLKSERPKRLKKAELEQYEVMLEEQAFPFEEKAIELHEANARRATDGLWNPWIERSFQALAQLRPVRYGKAERTDGATGEAAALNGRAVALRREGRFAEARDAYEQAIAADPRAGAPVLNLAILNDLYLGDRRRALELYERYQGLVQPADTTVTKWVADLRNRRPPSNLVSRKEGS